MKNILVEKNIPCELSEGTVLRSDVYRPNDKGKYPVLMLRLPYDKETPRYYDEYLNVPRMVKAGYVVILQDVRGRFASDGEYFPFVYERKDGYEAVEWAAKLPFSNGKVGLFGMSYHGYTQLAAAVEKPPSLKAIAPVMTMGNPFNQIPDGEGFSNLTGLFQSWVFGSMLEDHLQRKGKLDKKFQTYLEELPARLFDYPATTWEPIQDLDPESYYFDIMNDRLPVDVREDANVLNKLQDIEIPALFIGGWFDALIDSTLEVYDAYGGEKLLWIGPWTHEEMTGRAGEKFFENAAEWIGVDKIKDPTELHIKWFDHWLKDSPLPIEQPVHLYAMGQERWESYSSWPLQTEVTELYLESNGKSQTRDGDGKLAVRPSLNETKSALNLDPHHPVPIRGGNVLVAGYESGVFEISDIQGRKDVLVYTSEPFQEDKQMIGSVRADIWVSAPSSLVDIALRISDVDETGQAYNVIDTFHREKVEKPNEPTCIKLVIGTTSYLMKKGHRLRLDIAATKAPLYDINLNNGTTTKTNSIKTGKTANEYIYHGGQTSSKLILPLG